MITPIGFALVVLPIALVVFVVGFVGIVLRYDRQRKVARKKRKTKNLW